jgi:predicted permease
MGWTHRLRSLFRRKDHARDLEEELNFHLAMREQRNREHGLSPQEARRQARLRFGNPTLLRERITELDLILLPHTVWQDLRFGARILLRQWGLTLTAIFALALGIGISTAAFSAYKAFFARPLDARHPQTMTNLAAILHTGVTTPVFSYPDYVEYRDRLHTFSGIIATSLPQFLPVRTPGGTLVQHDEGGGSLIGRLFPLAGSSNNERALSMFVSENFFSVLGVQAIRGQVFRQQDTRQLATSPAVLISGNYWQRKFDSDPSIVGTRVVLNGASFTIMGVTPRNFVGTFVAAPDFWIPLSLEPLVHPEQNWLTDREKFCCHLRARLAPGVTLHQAQSEMSLLADRLRALHTPRSDWAQPLHAVVWPGSPFPIPPSQNRNIVIALSLVALAVALVLIVACANVASLQLARAHARHNELSMRLSLGASRLRLMRQLLTESALLAVIAGALAFLFSWAFLQWAVTAAANAFPDEYGTFVFHVTPDLSVFAFVLGISLAAGILFGFAPALDSSRSAIAASLRANNFVSLRRHRLRSLLIASQVALSAVLLIAGSLLIHSAIRALNMDTGYDDAHVVDLNLQFPENAGYSADRKTALVHQLTARLADLPGVADVTSARAPDDPDFRDAAVSINSDVPSRTNTKAFLFYTYVEPNYFQTLSIPLLFGHPFADTAEVSAILSESAAKALWPGENPIGKILRLSTERQFHGPAEPLPDGLSWRVIGVARDTRGVLLDGSDSAQIYLPMPAVAAAQYPILVRTRTNPATLIAQIGSLLASVDPALMVRALTLEDMLRSSAPFIASTVSAAIASVTGLLGLLLVTIGIYGTVSYVVVQRTPEVGIRMALGARKANVIALILRDSSRPVLFGLGIGLILAAGAAWLLRHVLYGIGLIDPLSFGGVSALLIAVALLAAFLPSRRAARVDPMVALRCE